MSGNVIAKMEVVSGRTGTGVQPVHLGHLIDPHAQEWSRFKMPRFKDRPPAPDGMIEQ